MSPAPWERRPSETPKAYMAFNAYRALGPKRSLRQLADGGEPAAG